MTDLHELFTRNAEFAVSEFSADLTINPSGNMMVVGCVDPRVDPAHVLGLRNGEAPVFEEGVEHAPRESAVGPAALQGQRHGLLGARPREATRLARLASCAARHRAVPLEVPVMNHSLAH